MFSIVKRAVWTQPQEHREPCSRFHIKLAKSGVAEVGKRELSRLQGNWGFPITDTVGQTPFRNAD